jgi:hypothetical protein
MNFGSEIVINRGTHNRKGKLGCMRKVKAVLTGTSGKFVFARLLQNDGLAVNKPNLKGETGTWEKSRIVGS